VRFLDVLLKDDDLLLDLRKLALLSTRSPGFGIRVHFVETFV
jgi:hypothetical protein